jgi:hypothetical protein
VEKRAAEAKIRGAKAGPDGGLHPTRFTHNHLSREPGWGRGITPDPVSYTITSSQGQVRVGGLPDQAQANYLPIREPRLADVGLPERRYHAVNALPR